MSAGLIRILSVGVALGGLILWMGGWLRDVDRRLARPGKMLGSIGIVPSEAIQKFRRLRILASGGLLIDQFAVAQRIGRQDMLHSVPEHVRVVEVPLHLFDIAVQVPFADLV